MSADGPQAIIPEGRRSVAAGVAVIGGVQR
jgi:hypothetical protein